MADDGEWHTVTSNKHAHPTAAADASNGSTAKNAHTASSSSQQASKARRKSRHKINAPKQQHAKDGNSHKKPSGASSTNATRSAKHSSRSHHGHDTSASSNPFHAPADDDDSDEEEEDGQVDPIDLPVPPYHTTIVVSCPLSDCDSPIPFLDTTSLVKHLKTEHKLMFKNLHHMYMALDAYLARWAKELAAKPVTEYAQLEPSDNGEGKIIIV